MAPRAGLKLVPMMGPTAGPKLVPMMVPRAGPKLVPMSGLWVGLNLALFGPSAGLKKNPKLVPMLGLYPLVSLLLLASLWSSSARAETGMFHQLGLNTVDVNTTSTASRSCDCRVQCVALNCSTYSVTKHSEESFTCQVSLDPVPHYALKHEGDKPVYVEHKTDYKFYGSNFYMIFSLANELMKNKREPYDAKTRKTTTALELDRSGARDHCLSEGGQLAVVNTNETMPELGHAMEDAGVNKVWVGLYREKLNDDFTEYEVPNWIFNNGTNITSPNVKIERAAIRCFNVDITRTPDVHLNNLEKCGIVMPFACQRDY